MVLPKPPKVNPPVPPAAGLREAPAPKTELLFEGVDPPKIDEPAVPLKLPKIDGLLSYCADDDGDSADGLSSFVATVGFDGCAWDLSALRKENLIFSLELKGVFGADAVDGVEGAELFGSFLPLSVGFFVAVLFSATAAVVGGDSSSQPAQPLHGSLFS